MIVVDTNLLVYGHRPECPLHQDALACVENLAESGRRWGIAVHCLVEFAAVVSSPRIWLEPSTASHIENQVSAWRSSGNVNLLADDSTVWKKSVELATSGKVAAAQWYDARIAAVFVAHGGSELWTCDRDYSRFPDVKTRNPLIGS